MNSAQKYRPFITREIALDFQKSLEKAIKKIKPKKLGFIGIIDSPKKEYHHDIDVLLFPAKKAKIGQVLIELIRIYDETEKILKKKKKEYYLVTCPLMSMQQLMYYIAGLEKGFPGMVPIHSLFFINYQDFKKCNPKEFQKEIKKTLITLHGKFAIVKELEKLPQKKLEPYYFILNYELTTRIKNFPKHSAIASAEHLFQYLNEKYNITINTDKIHTRSEIEKEFIKLIKKLDEITYS